MLSQSFTQSQIIKRHIKQEQVNKSREELVNNEYKSDVTFLVGAEKSKMYGHKLLLEFSNNYFKTLIEESKSDEVELPDIEPEIFLEILKFIYCGKIDLQPENFVRIYMVADSYLMEDLKTICYKTLNEENVTRIFSDNTDTFQSEELDKACMKIICTSPFSVFEDVYFEQLTMDALKKILLSQLWYCSKKDIESAIETWLANNADNATDEELAELKGAMFAMPYERLYFKPIRYSTNYNSTMTISLKCMVPTTLFGFSLLRNPDSKRLEVKIEINDSFDEYKVLKTVTKTFNFDPKNTQLMEELFFKKIDIEAHQILRITFIGENFATFTSRQITDKRLQLIRQTSYEAEIETPIQYLICTF